MGAEAILIIRTSAMGDIVMSSHLAEGLRSRYPDARICWLAEPQVAPLLEHNPALDAVIVWPKLRWKELLRTRQWGLLVREVRDFIVRLRSERFSLAIDAQGLLRTRLLAWLSGARERVGFESREQGQFLMTRLIREPIGGYLMGSEYFYLLQQLGVSTDELRQTIHLAPEHYAEARKVLDGAGVNVEYIVFVPFTTRTQKHWFEQNWIRLAREITSEYSLPVVWLGGGYDRSAAKILADAGGGVSLAGVTSLAVSAAIVAQATLVVGVDTGLTHLGTAFLVPTLALFGSTCPYTATCSPVTTILYHSLPCSPCRRRPICEGRFECMQMLMVEEVMQAAERICQVRHQV
ncbi:MAG: glycosyltransferase family 9 protein [Desulfobacter sp.]